MIPNQRNCNSTHQSCRGILCSIMTMAILVTAGRCRYLYKKARYACIIGELGSCP